MGLFFIGVKNSKGIKTETQINEEEWEEEENINRQDGKKSTESKMAIPEEIKTETKLSDEVTEKEPEPKKDVKDKLADLKSEFKKTKKEAQKSSFR